jgi:hypothetical protein
MEMLSKEQSLTLLGGLATASITGVGLAIGGAIGATVMAGIGINLSSIIIHNGCFKLKERWLYSANGLVNHDIQKALARAFSKALSSLEVKYLETEQASMLEKYERESIKDIFKELKENAETRVFLSLERIQLDSNVKHFLLNDRDFDTAEVWERIVGDEFISKYGLHLKNFIQQHLLNETLFWFGEELKTDNRDCNKAWRAFQRMLLEGMYAEVKAVRANQEQIAQDLRKLDVLGDQLNELQQMIDRRVPNELFQKELENVLNEISPMLHTIVRTSERIDESVKVIQSDVKSLLERIEPPPPPLASRQMLREELAQIRRSMILADSGYDLQEAFYQVEEFLSKNPHYSEARVLKDQIQAALNNGLRRKLALEEIAHTANKGVSSDKRKIGYTWILFSGLLLLLLYLLVRWLI